nr:hypothetical protein CFP56_13486 [Quercus suber]
MAWCDASEIESPEVEWGIPVGRLVILESTWDHDRWMDQTKQVFQILHVWQYCDLHASPEDRAVEPKRLEELRLYNLFGEIYTYDHNAKLTANQYLTLSVAESVLPTLWDRSTLDGRLQDIKRCFEPSEMQRLAMFNKRLETLKPGYQANGREQWLNAWLMLRSDIRGRPLRDRDLASHFLAPLYRQDRSTARVLDADTKGRPEIGVGDAIRLYRNLMDSPSPETDRSNATLHKDTSNSVLHSRRKKPKGCGNITGKSKSEQCANLGDCNVVNASKRPAREERTDERKNARRGCPEAKKMIDRRRGKSFQSDPREDDDIPGDQPAFSTYGVDATANYLHDGCLFSTASIMHIINDTSKAKFVMTGTATFTMAIGNRTVETADVGTATLPLYDHSLQKEIQSKLTDCVYLPEHSTNIISASRLWKRRVTTSTEKTAQYSSTSMALLESNNVLPLHAVLSSRPKRARSEHERAYNIVEPTPRLSLSFAALTLRGSFVRDERKRQSRKRRRRTPKRGPACGTRDLRPLEREQHANERADGRASDQHGGAFPKDFCSLGRMRQSDVVCQGLRERGVLGVERCLVWAQREIGQAGVARRPNGGDEQELRDGGADGEEQQHDQRQAGLVGVFEAAQAVEMHNQIGGEPGVEAAVHGDGEDRRTQEADQSIDAPIVRHHLVLRLRPGRVMRLVAVAQQCERERGSHDVDGQGDNRGAVVYAVEGAEQEIIRHVAERGQRGQVEICRVGRVSPAWSRQTGLLHSGYIQSYPANHATSGPASLKASDAPISQS